MKRVRCEQSSVYFNRFDGQILTSVGFNRLICHGMFFFVTVCYNYAKMLETSDKENDFIVPTKKARTIPKCIAIPGDDNLEVTS